MAPSDSRTDPRRDRRTQLSGGRFSISALLTALATVIASFQSATAQEILPANASPRPALLNFYTVSDDQVASDDPLFDEWDEDWIDPDPGSLQETPSWLSFNSFDGLRFHGPDGVPRLHLGGKIEFAAFDYDRRNSRDSEIRPEGMELRLEGEALDRAWLRVVADLDGRETRDGLREAWFTTRLLRYLNLTVGLQRFPIGIEASIDRDELPFTGPGFSSWLAERTDLGIRVDGEVLDGFLSYDVGWSVGEGFDLDAQALRDPRLSAHLVLYPLTPDLFLPQIEGSSKWLHGLFLSAGYALETDFDRSISVETPLHNLLFQSSEISASDAQWWNFGWGLDAGALRITHEWLVGSLEDVETGTGTIDLNDQLTSMAATVSLRIGGPDYDTHPLRNRPIPESWDKEEDLPFLPKFEFPGEVELAFRYANGDLDRRLFELGFADFAVSSQEFRTATGSVSLRPSENTRILFEVTRVIADQFPAAFDSHGRDTSWTIRFIWTF